jgi:penicillin-binding protein 1A
LPHINSIIRRRRAKGAALATYRPSIVTRIYADDGKTVIGEFALEKRIPLKYDEIPPVMKNAILAVEDVRFLRSRGHRSDSYRRRRWKNLTSKKLKAARR